MAVLYQCYFRLSSKQKYCEAIMDDLILFIPLKESHINKLEDILSALLKNGLKISPKKCQLFKTSLQYMGNEMFIESKKVCMKPLRSRLEAIQKLQPPKTSKGCRSFAGVVNFLSMFCPELQKLLKPIYDLTRKGRPFYWGKEQQDSFTEIKCRLVKPPILHMPNKTGRFHLYSDTSKHMTGSTLYEIQGEIIPISFNAYGILEENRNIPICEKNEERFLIQMCSQAKMSSTRLPEVHGVRKELDPNLRPEKQHAMPKKGMIEKPHAGQGRAGLRRKHEPDCINQPSAVTRRISGASKIVTGKTNSSQHTNGVHDRGINND